jgi:hypothetical protein
MVNTLPQNASGAKQAAGKTNKRPVSNRRHRAADGGGSAGGCRHA